MSIKYLFRYLVLLELMCNYVFNFYMYFQGKDLPLDDLNALDVFSVACISFVTREFYQSILPQSNLDPRLNRAVDVSALLVFRS